MLLTKDSGGIDTEDSELLPRESAKRDGEQFPELLTFMVKTNVRHVLVLDITSQTRDVTKSGCFKVGQRACF